MERTAWPPFDLGKGLRDFLGIPNLHGSFSRPKSHDPSYPPKNHRGKETNLVRYRRKVLPIVKGSGKLGRWKTVACLASIASLGILAALWWLLFT